MYKIPNTILKPYRVNNSIEGETLERQLARAVLNKEPLIDKNSSTPLIYTERKQGVLPSTNIRTDRFEVAVEATDKIAQSYKARRENKPESKSEKEVGETKSVQGKTETVTGAEIS